MVKDIAPGRPSSLPDQLTAVGKTLYFTARDGIHGPELWRSNGTARGTRLVNDIVPGQGAYNLGSFTNVAGTLFFVASAAPQSGTQTGLWAKRRYREGRRRLVKQLCSRSTIRRLVGHTLYFAASDGTRAGLWRSDGTTSGTDAGQGIGGRKGSVAPLPATSPTWPARSSLAPPTGAPTPGCGEATAPRRGRRS